MNHKTYHIKAIFPVGIFFLMLLLLRIAVDVTAAVEERETNQTNISSERGGNTPPEVSDVQISPANPGDNDNLVLSYTYSDADGDPEGDSIIEWHKNSQRVEAYDGLTIIPYQETSVGEVWHVFVIPHDGQEYGDRRAAHSVRIGSETGNTPPEVSDVQISPANPGDDDNLLLSYTYFDADGDLEGDTIIRWYKDLQHMPGYDGRSVIPDQLTRVGEVWYAVVIPHDGQEYGSQVAAHSVVIGTETGNTAPEVRNVYLSPGVPGDDEDLRLYYTYYDEDGDLEQESEIRWTRNLIAEAAYHDQTSIPAAATTVGESWCATVTPHDGTDFGNEVASNCVTIQTVGRNTPPEAREAHIVPARPTSSDDLELNYTYFDADGDGQSQPIIYWYRNGILVSDFDNQTVVPASNLSQGERWYATIQPHDGMDPGALVTTTAVTINTPPEFTNIVITPSEPTTNQDLTLSPYGYRDADNDPPNSEQILWYKSSVHQREYDNQPIIPASATSAGDSWQAVITPHDGYEYGLPSISNKIVISAGPLYLPLMLLQPMPTQTPPPTATPKPTCLRAEQEPNNTSVNAYINLPLCNGIVLEGALPDESDLVDIYRIEVTQPGTIIADLTHIPAGTDYHLFLYISSHSLPIEESLQPRQEPEQIIWDVQSGTYYLSVHAHLGRSSQPYQLRVESMSITQPPTPIPTPTPTLTATPIPTATPTPTGTPTPTLPFEPNDRQDTAYGPLTFGQTYDAYPEDQDDWYYFVITETSSVEVEVTNYTPASSGQLVLYKESLHENNGLPRQFIAHDGGVATTKRIPNEADPDALTNLSPGKYLVRIYTVERYTEDQLYHLRVQLPTPRPTPTLTPTATATATPGPGTAFEPNDTQETAYGPLISGQEYDAYPEDQDDWYYFEITETSSAQVEVTNYRAEGQLVVYQEYFDPENGLQRQVIATDGRGRTTMQIPNELDPDVLSNLPPSKYFVRIFTVGDYRDDELYRLRVLYQEQ